jgi:hypothetical protein
MKDQIGNFTGYPVNYDPKLTKSQDIGNLWIFKNGVNGPGFMGFQASVVDSIQFQGIQAILLYNSDQ